MPGQKDADRLHDVRCRRPLAVDLDRCQQTSDIVRACDSHHDGITEPIDPLRLCLDRSGRAISAPPRCNMSSGSRSRRLRDTNTMRYIGRWKTGLAGPSIVLRQSFSREFAESWVGAADIVWHEG
jgi:hypothetical protein